MRQQVGFPSGQLKLFTCATLVVCSSARSFALRLPSNPSSRKSPCLRLVVIVQWIKANGVNRSQGTVWSLPVSIVVGSPTGDFHPISSCPCRAYTKPLKIALRAGPSQAALASAFYGDVGMRNLLQGGS